MTSYSGRPEHPYRGLILRGGEGHLTHYPIRPHELQMQWDLSALMNRYAICANAIPSLLFRGTDNYAMRPLKKTPSSPAEVLAQTQE